MPFNLMIHEVKHTDDCFFKGLSIIIHCNELMHLTTRRTTCDKFLEHKKTLAKLH